MSTPPHSRARLSTQRTEEGTTKRGPSLRDTVTAIDSQSEIHKPAVSTARVQHTSGQSLGNISQWPGDGHGQAGMSKTYKLAMNPGSQYQANNGPDDDRQPNICVPRTLQIAREQHELRDSKPPLPQAHKINTSVVPLSTLPARDPGASHTSIPSQHTGKFTTDNHSGIDSQQHSRIISQGKGEAWQNWGKVPPSSQPFGPITSNQSLSPQQYQQYLESYNSYHKNQTAEQAWQIAMCGIGTQRLSQEQSDRARSSLHTGNAESTSIPQGTSRTRTTTLTEWLENNSLPERLSANDEGTKELRRKIIHAALLITAEVERKSSVHGFKLSNILSPNNFILTETITNNSTELKVSIQERSASEDTPLTAPWLRHSSLMLKSESEILRGNSEEVNEQIRRNYNVGRRQAVIFALGAIYRTLCEGGTTFLQDDNYNWCRLFEDGNNQKVYSHWDFFSRWKFFILAHACLQVEKGNIYGIPDNPLIEIDIKKVIDILRESADEEYANSDEINVHLDHLRAQIAHNFRTVYSFIPFE